MVSLRSGDQPIWPIIPQNDKSIYRYILPRTNVFPQYNILQYISFLVKLAQTFTVMLCMFPARSSDEILTIMRSLPPEFNRI